MDIYVHVCVCLCIVYEKRFLQLLTPVQELPPTMCAPCKGVTCMHHDWDFTCVHIIMRTRV